MNHLHTTLLAALALPIVLLSAQEPKPAGSAWEKKLTGRTDRGTLSDKREMVRGDTGKWNDKATLQHVPPIQQKPQGLSLDDWADALAEKKAVTTAADDNWLLFRTRQLDDNDRVWIEKIDRRGNEFAVVLNEAIWQGHYFKTFTYYEVTAVNLGPLPPGDYTVKWIVKPMTFKQLEKPKEAQRDYRTNWPTDEQADGQPAELRTAFSVR